VKPSPGLASEGKRMNFKSRFTANESASDRQMKTEGEFFKLFTLISQAVVQYRGIGPVWDADDIAQESYLWLWEFLNTDHLCREYLEISVKKNIDNRIRNKRRLQSRYYQLIEKLLDAGTPAAQLPEKIEVERELIRKCIDRALERLTPKQKETFILFFGLNGDPMSVTEIAKFKNKNPRSVRKERFLGCETLAQDPDLQSLAS
jgi:RNA polymerase sigma factor (sigma-70 family)